MKALLIATTLLPQSVLSGQDVTAHWNKGAEISSYDLVQSRYGEVHKGHAEFIFVREPFLPDQQVKDESNGPNGVPVLKLNALRTFNTGIYSYRTMTSTFRAFDVRTFPHTLKSTTSVQDWCGQAFQQMNFRGGKWSAQLRSYFQNEGDRDFTLPAAHLEDGLWLTIRLDPTLLPVGKTELIPGALFSRFAHILQSPSEARATLEAEGNLQIYSVTYAPPLDRTLSITFDTQFPHIIRSWTEGSSRGPQTTATLKRFLPDIDYWNRNAPGDASQRRNLGLAPLPN